MNPQFDKPNNLNLPPPMVEATPQILPDSPEQTQSQPEIMPGALETGPQLATAPPMVLPNGAPQQQQGPVTNNDVSNTTLIATPVIADDSDLIEKEWVTKAKEIVNKTKEDPHRQSKDMTAFRADYMQKRYNKTIKITE